MAMGVRAIRGATTLDTDTKESMTEAVCELLLEIFEANQISHDDLISLIFTSTPDLVSTFPATAARTLNLGDVPLICAVEVSVPDTLKKTVRVMVHVQSEKTLAQIKHVYKRGAVVLRQDLAQ